MKVSVRRPDRARDSRRAGTIAAPERGQVRAHDRRGRTALGAAGAGDAASCVDDGEGSSGAGVGLSGVTVAFALSPAPASATAGRGRRGVASLWPRARRTASRWPSVRACPRRGRGYGGRRQPPLRREGRRLRGRRGFSPALFAPPKKCASPPPSSSPAKMTIKTTGRAEVPRRSARHRIAGDAEFPQETSVSRCASASRNAAGRRDQIGALLDEGAVASFTRSGFLRAYPRSATRRLPGLRRCFERRSGSFRGVLGRLAAIVKRAKSASTNARAASGGIAESSRS